MTTSAQPTSRPWSPNGDAHLIYQWVKMEGKTQAWVASALRIDQSTVSRILQRYDRWQAHAKERENGRLDPAERLRAQRWLTFERNELILTSCLRIAQDMEGSIDTAKSTIHRQASRPSQETEIRTHHATIDRTGSVARFLRLAFRINTEQLKLAQLDPPPLATPLTAEELAAEALQAALDDQELARSRSLLPEGTSDPVGNALRGVPPTDGTATSSPPTTDCTNPPNTAPPNGATPQPPSPPPSLSPLLPPSVSPSHLPAVPNPEPRTPSLAPLHNLHNENPPQIAASSDQPCSCIVDLRLEKNAAPCITDPDNVGRSGSERPAPQVGPPTLAAAMT